MSSTITNFNQGAQALRQGAQLRVNADGTNLHQVSGLEKVSLAFKRMVMRATPETLGTGDAAIAKALVNLYRAEHGGATRFDVARELGKMGLDRLADHLQKSPPLGQRQAQLEPELDDTHQTLAQARQEAAINSEDRFGVVSHRSAAKPSTPAATPHQASETPPLPDRSLKSKAAERRSQAVEVAKQATVQRQQVVAKSAPPDRSNSPGAMALVQALRSAGYAPTSFASDLKPLLEARWGAQKYSAIANPQSGHYTHLGEGARYKDIGTPTHSVVKLGGGHLIHANHMPPFGGLSANTIASQAPKANTMQDFVRMTQEQDVRTIIDLTGAKDKAERKIPDYGRDPRHGFVSQGQPSPELEQIGLQKRQLQAADNPQASSISYLNFTAWPDHGVIETPKFSALLSAIAREHGSGSGGLTVHCNAGVGRTGTVMAGLELQRMAAKGELRQDNFADKVLDVVALGRDNRGSAFVQTHDQLRMLFDYAQSQAR